MIMEDLDKKELLAILADRLNQSMRMYMENCTRCGVCIDACHAYASTGDIRYSAVARSRTCAGFSSSTIHIPVRLRHG